MCVRPESVEIIDFKTDLSRHAEDEYLKQLSVYYHVLSEWFPKRDVTASIFYTAEGMRVDTDPVSRPQLVDIERAVMKGTDDDTRSVSVSVDRSNVD